MQKLLRNRWVWIALGVVLLGASGLWGLSEGIRASESIAIDKLTETMTDEYVAGLESVQVTQVVDGDTIKVVAADKPTEERTVRLIGVDTPESVHPDPAKNTEAGRVASHYTTAMLLGRTVGLEFDVERYDKYGRELAYVWVGNAMYNLQLCFDGVAVLLTMPPNVKYVDYFTKAQEQAKAEKVGVWE